MRTDHDEASSPSGGYESRIAQLKQTFDSPEKNSPKQEQTASAWLISILSPRPLPILSTGLIDISPRNPDRIKRGHARAPRKYALEHVFKPDGGVIIQMGQWDGDTRPKPGSNPRVGGLDPEPEKEDGRAWVDYYVDKGKILEGRSRLRKVTHKMHGESVYVACDRSAEGAAEVAMELSSILGWLGVKPLFHAYPRGEALSSALDSLVRCRHVIVILSSPLPSLPDPSPSSTPRSDLSLSSDRPFADSDSDLLLREVLVALRGRCHVVTVYAPGFSFPPPTVLRRLPAPLRVVLKRRPVLWRHEYKQHSVRDLVMALQLQHSSVKYQRYLDEVAGC